MPLSLIEGGVGESVHQSKNETPNKEREIIMATLRTIGWTQLEGERVCKELVIPLKKITFAQEHDGDTCLVQVSARCGLWIDVPIRQMRQILNEHHKDPNKDFDTHPDVTSEMLEEQRGKDWR
jgi:hypothetical protein